MDVRSKHLIFYDGNCGLCDKVVQLVLKIDTQEIFLFAPLQGKTAAKMLQALPQEVREADSVILIEQFRGEKPAILIFGKAAFRILWLIGGWWTPLGWISFLPSVLYDWGYRLIARNRHLIFRQDICVIPSTENRSRFLD